MLRKGITSSIIIIERLLSPSQSSHADQTEIINYAKTQRSIFWENCTSTQVGLCTVAPLSARKPMGYKLNTSTLLHGWMDGCLYPKRFFLQAYVFNATEENRAYPDKD